MFMFRFPEVFVVDVCYMYHYQDGHAPPFTQYLYFCAGVDFRRNLRTSSSVMMRNCKRGAT